MGKNNFVAEISAFEEVNSTLCLNEGLEERFAALLSAAMQDAAPKNGVKPSSCGAELVETSFQKPYIYGVMEDWFFQYVLKDEDPTLAKVAANAAATQGWGGNYVARATRRADFVCFVNHLLEQVAYTVASASFLEDRPINACLGLMDRLLRKCYGAICHSKLSEPDQRAAKKILRPILPDVWDKKHWSAARNAFWKKVKSMRATITSHMVGNNFVR